MAENNEGSGSEERFFGSAPREDSGFVGKAEPIPPAWPKVVGALVLLAAIGGLVWWQSKTPPEGSIWVMNPGPLDLQIGVGDRPAEEVRAGRVLDKRIRAAEGVPVTISSPGKKTVEQLDVAPKQVTLLDLTGDAAYVILDVSAHYGTAAEPESFPITFVSKPARVHHFPVSALALVRPGQPLPDKGSWELNAFKPDNKALEIQKVFRIDPKRADDIGATVKRLSEAVRAGRAGELENLRAVETSTVAARE